MKERALPAMLAVLLCPPLFAQTANSTSADETAASPPPPPQIYGTVIGDTYTSPTGVFQIKIPVLPQLGGSVSDTPNLVTFDDDFTTHISVGAFPLSRELKWEYETRGTKDFLAFFFANAVMPDFAAKFPGARMEDNGLYLPKFQDGSMLIFTLLPGGSLFAPQVTLFPPRTPLVAKRGNLCFVKYGYVFVVSEELAERILEHSTYHKTVDEENALLRDRLMAVVRLMTFIKPPEAKD
jgi:hypothetical protein